jgi:XTP/dITP diphosphohydrolase
MAEIELIFATSNQSKLGQMSYVIETTGASVRLVSGRERFGDEAAYQEQGISALEVARLGAIDVAARVGTPVMAEDTTLHVSLLSGAPGLESKEFLHRFGREGLLHLMQGLQHRQALVVSAVAWATPEGTCAIWLNLVHGDIAEEERSTSGLPTWVAPSPEQPLGGGYNAIFVPEGQTRTLAETPPDEAMRLGYREPNFCALLRFLVGGPGIAGLESLQGMLADCQAHRVGRRRESSPGGGK